MLQVGDLITWYPSSKTNWGPLNEPVSGIVTQSECQRGLVTVRWFKAYEANKQTIYEDEVWADKCVLIQKAEN